MTGSLTDLVTWAFVAANAGRVFAYLPQIVAAARCKNGATAVSRTTWSYFAFAHFTGAMYGLVVIHDFRMALVFIGNFFACCILVGLVAWKKWRHHRGYASVRLPTPKAASTAMASVAAAPASTAAYQPRSMKTPNNTGARAKPTSRPEYTSP